MSGSDTERFRDRVTKSVEEFELPNRSRWERSRIYKTGARWLEHLFFERHLQTVGRTYALEHFEPDFVHYEPSAWLAMRWALRQVRPGPHDVFVDFGAGKGRVVCQAARHSFARVIGVEVAHTLTEIAQRNVELNLSRFKCQDIQLVTADAAQWDIPAEMTVAYLYHPFAGNTFQRVLDNIIDSIERSPRRLRLIYLCPLLEDRILDTGYFLPIGRRRGRGNRGRVVNTVVLMEHDPSRSHLVDTGA